MIYPHTLGKLCIFYTNFQFHPNFLVIFSPPRNFLSPVFTCSYHEIHTSLSHIFQWGSVVFILDKLILLFPVFKLIFVVSWHFDFSFCVYIFLCFFFIASLQSVFASSREDAPILMEGTEYGKGLQRTNNYQYMAQCMYELIKAGGGGVLGGCVTLHCEIAYEKSI